MNNSTWNSTWSGTPTCDTTSGGTMTFSADGMVDTTTDTTWFPYYMESTWRPYYYDKYFPAYHLLKSYGISKNHHSRNRLARFWKKLKKYLKIPLS